MNLTFEEVKLYHYRLWDEVVRTLPDKANMGIFVTKCTALDKLRSEGLLPKEYPDNCCYLCEYYKEGCKNCPLDNCHPYFMIRKALEAKDVKRAVSLAKSIRDIYK